MFMETQAWKGMARDLVCTAWAGQVGNCGPILAMSQPYDRVPVPPPSLRPSVTRSHPSPCEAVGD